MDIVTLGAALNGAKTQTESIVNSHFVEGTNITIVDNVDGTQTINRLCILFSLGLFP